MYYHYLIYVYYGIISSTILLFYSIDPFFISFFRLSLSLSQSLTGPQRNEADLESVIWPPLTFKKNRLHWLHA